MPARIYLDHNASTSIDPRVLEAMLPLYSFPHNPSSVHFFGQKAKSLLEEAHQSVAHAFGVHPQEIIFTSGATEALNMMLFGILHKRKKGHIITSRLEHPAVIQPLEQAQARGFEVTFLSSSRGAVSVDQIQNEIRSDTCLIVCMAVNNETGIKSDLGKIAALAESLNIPLLVDGVAWLGKDVLTIAKGVSTICFSGHKIHGPAGVGVAVVKKSLKWSPLIYGGPQQLQRRGGTENLPAIVGFSKALKFLQDELSTSISSMAYLRDRFEKTLKEALSDIIIHGSLEERVCNTSNISFLGVDGETLIMRLDLAAVAASHGSACSSGALEPSRILLNMGIPVSVARSSVRFSLSKYTTEQEIDRAASIIIQEVKHLRER